MNDTPTKEEILSTIRQAILDALPSRDAILEAISEGISLNIYRDDICKAISDSMPFPSEITQALYEGAYKAIKHKDDP